MKIGFLYAGQGSQQVGMGRELYDAFAVARAAFDAAALDFDVKALCFDGPLERLTQTQYTQPCLVAEAVAATAVLRELGVLPAMAAGLSLGEYPALFCAGVLDESTVLSLARFRGLAMEESSAGVSTRMSAVLGLGREPLEAVCREASARGIVQIANLNCPGQIVIGGETEAVALACELAKQAGAKRCLPLNVSGPFHTPLMEPAARRLAERLREVSFGTMRLPVVFNATGTTLQEGETIAALLTRQVTDAVRFEDCVRTMLSQGIEAMVEIGPGQALSGFLKKIDPTVPVYKADTVEAVRATAAALAA